jgi:SAM-dependent methyltransferase
MKSCLHLGCGKRKRPGAIGVDIYAGSDADVLCDLNRFPYPFASDTFDEIIAEHVLEHLDDLVGVVEELHRIARPGARLLVEVPHFSSVFYYQDPTHRHPFTSRTFDYFVHGTDVHHFGYSKACLEVVKVEFPPPPEAGPVKRAFFRWVNRHIDAYEKHLAFVLPRHLMRFELKIVK